MKTRYLAFLLVMAAALTILPGAAAQANLPVVPAKMACTLSAFQALNLNGVADDKGQVTFQSVTFYSAGSTIGSGRNAYTTPAALCAVNGNIGPGTATGDNFVMWLPMNNWTQRYVHEGCGGECGSANLGAPTQAVGCLPANAG